MQKGHAITITLLCFISCINYMDRYTIAAILKPLKDFYNLNNSQKGLLQTVFIVSFMLSAPLFGYLGDRSSRRYIICAGIFFSSSTTLLGSFVPPDKKELFFVLRALVGIGEASFSTIAPAIIADLFSKDQRTKMLGLFYLAIPVGSGLGFATGALMSSLFNDWRYALRFTPLFGLISMFFVLFLMIDPPRGESDGLKDLESHEIKADLIYLLSIPSFIWSTIGYTCICFTTGCLTWFAVDFFTNSLKLQNSTMSEEKVSYLFGAVSAIGGISGILLGTVICKWLRKYTEKAEPLLCCFDLLAVVPCLFIVLSISTKSFNITWIFLLICITLFSLNWATVADMSFLIVHPSQRALSQSLQILVSHLLGDALSPFLIGMVIDKIQQNDSIQQEFQSTQYAMYINCFVALFGALCFYLSSVYYIADKENCLGKIAISNCSTSCPMTDESSSVESGHLHSFPPSNMYVAEEDPLFSKVTTPK